MCFRVLESFKGHGNKNKWCVFLKGEVVSNDALKKVGYDTRNIRNLIENKTIKKVESSLINQDAIIDAEKIKKRKADIEQAEKEEEKKKKDEKYSDILHQLSKAEVPAYHIDQDSDETRFWYGFRTNEGQCLILSDKTFLKDDEIKRAFQHIEGYIGSIAPTISRKAVLDFYNGKTIHIKEIFEKVKEQFEYFMDFGDDNTSSVLTCWVIATHCFTLFEWFPNILFNAPSQSGKSKCGYLLMKMSYRGFDLGASAGVTPAQVFRTLEGNRGTLFFDEFERSKNPNDESQRLVLQIINSGNSKNAYVIRCEQVNKKWYSRKFGIFCPKIVCNISGINPTSLSRFLPFKWLKTASNKGQLKPERKQYQQGFKEIYDACAICSLTSWKAILETSEKLKVNWINNRDYDNLLPLLVVAHLVDNENGNQEVEQKIKNYWNGNPNLEVETGDMVYDFLLALYESSSDLDEQVTPQAISGYSKMSGIFEGIIKHPSYWIGRKLKLYKFPFRRTGSARTYTISKERVRKILELYYGEKDLTQK